MDLSHGVVAVRAEPDWKGRPEAPPTAPPLVKATPALPPPPRKPPPAPPKPPPPAPPPSKAQPPPGPIRCPVGQKPTKSGKGCVVTDEEQAARDAIAHDQERRQAIRDYTDATLGDGFKNASEVAKWASRIIPGPAGRAFKGAQEFFEGVHDIYEAGKLVEQLVNEMSQSDAMAKGSEEVAKQGEDAFTKIAEKKLDAILKRKNISIPEPLKKEIIKGAREFFDKKIRDPFIEKRRKEFEDNLDPKERDKTPLQQWKDQWDRGTWKKSLPLFR
jgi:hypothetical protein